MAETFDRYAQDLDRVLAVSRAMSAERALDPLLDLILAAAKDLLRADRCSLFLLDADSGELWTRIAQDSGTIRLPPGKGIAGSVAASRELVNIADAYADDRFDASNDAISGYRTRNMIALPLISHEDSVVGVLQVLNKRGADAFDAYDEQLATALCSQAAVAVDTAQLIERDRERQRLARDMELARDIQQGLLPQAVPTVAGWRFAHPQVPCDATGGDYHDYLQVDDRIDLVVGDVAGHGIGAALLMSTARASLRALAGAGGGPEELLARLNTLLVADMADDRFMTMLLCRLDPDGGCRYAAAGHEPPLIYRTATGGFDHLDSTGLMLGVLAQTDYDAVAVPPLAPGDILVGFTDGIIEASAGDGRQWGRAAVREVVAATAHQGADAVLAALRAGVERHLDGAGMNDDLTVVVAERVA